jgi:hypothetical protein
MRVVVLTRRQNFIKKIKHFGEDKPQFSCLIQIKVYFLTLFQISGQLIGMGVMDGKCSSIKISIQK